jgi:outer membrane cobalamin receptor
MSLIASLLLPAIIWQGQFVDAVSNEPVPYVEVRILPAGITLFTDTTGSFTIQFDQPPGPLTVQAQRIGYRSRTWDQVKIEPGTKFTLFPAAIPVAGVTSTATRLQKKPLTCLPRTVINSGLTAPDISSLAGLLSQSPGTLINDYNNLFTVALRGTSPEQTLILLDGVPLNSSLNGLTDLTLIAPDLIQQLDVARGGASALYGTSSVGGVINLITPEPEKKELAFRLGLGSFGVRSVSTWFSLPAGRGSSRLPVAGGAEFTRADNNYPYFGPGDSLEFRKNAGFSRASGLLKSAVSIGTNQSLPVLLHFTTATRGSPGPVSFPSESARLSDHRLLIITGYDLLAGEHARLSARFHHQRQLEHYDNPDPYFTAADTHQTERTGITINQRLGFSGSEFTNDWLLGGEGNFERTKSTAVGTPGRTTVAGYLETGLNWRFFRLNPALRYELLRNLYPGQNPGARLLGVVSYRLLLTVNPVLPLSLYLSANRSFRAPTFNELFWPEDPWTRGNPGLEPEWATGFDAGIAWQTANQGSIRLNCFASRLENLIQWVFDSIDSIYHPVNIERAQIAGLELEPGFDFGLLGLKGNLTFQQCRAETTALPYRPNLAGKLLTWLSWGKSPRFRLTLGANGASMRFTDRANTDTLPGYFTLDLGIESWLAFRNLKFGIAAGCQNLFDRRYETIRAYPQPGRSFYLKSEFKI